MTNPTISRAAISSAVCTGAAPGGSGSGFFFGPAAQRIGRGVTDLQARGHSGGCSRSVAGGETTGKFAGGGEYVDVPTVTREACSIRRESVALQPVNSPARQQFISEAA